MAVGIVCLVHILRLSIFYIPILVYKNPRHAMLDIGPPIQVGATGIEGNTPMAVVTKVNVRIYKVVAVHPI